MRAVNLHRIKAQAFGVRRALGESSHHIGDILLAHNVPVDLARHVHARGCIAVDIALGRRARAAHAATVPELRRYLATFGVHRLGDFLPGREAFFTPEIGHIGVTVGSDVIHAGAFGDNQAAAASRAAPVILQGFLAGDVFRRLIAGHGRHHDAVGQFKLAQGERAE